VFFSQKVAYVWLKFGQNQDLWSQNGDTMSLGLGDVFQLMKKVTLPFDRLCGMSLDR
jgi:hypothetical protein